MKICVLVRCSFVSRLISASFLKNAGKRIHGDRIRLVISKQLEKHLKENGIDSKYIHLKADRVEVLIADS